MSRGPRQSGSSAGGGQQQQQNVRRGNKTLGWYLGGLVPGENNNGGGLEEAGDSKQQQAMRKSSLEDSSRSSPKFFNGDEQQQQQRRSQHLNMKQNRFIMSQQQQQANRPRANSSASAAKKPLTTTSNNNSNIGQHQLGQNGGGQGQQQVDFHKSGGGGKPANGKENYWYYDPVSDGYYYEHNGTRGWRKRNAKLDAAVQAAQKGLEEVKVAEQQKKMAEASKAMMAQQQQQSSNVPSLLGTHQQQQQLGKLAAPPNAANGAAAATAVPFGSPMAIKYFDSDGYFYEMASVDGWRRRQPGATPPNNSLASSLGAMPKAPSPIPAAAAVVPVHRRRIQPVQYQAYQQPPPHLNTVDLHEMVMLAQQQQHHNGTGHGQHHQSCCANKTTQCCANSSAPACYCTIAALAAQMVLQKQQQMMAMKDVGGGVEALATEFGKSKAMAMDSARPLFEGFSSKSGQFASFEPNHASRLAHPTAQPFSLSANWEQYQPHNKWAPLSAGNGNASKKVCHNNQEEKTTSLPVGSFEEPYEFYWSGDEASCELAPPPNKSGGNIQTDSGIGISTTTTAASISSIDDDGLEEMMGGGQQEGQKKQQQLQFIPPIGSETTKKGEEKRTKMRPDSLRLNCPKSMADAYVPISPGEIVRNPFGKENAAANAMSFLPPQNFDVDKFIADLPPMPVNHEQILHSLRNPLRTPIGPPTAAAEPCTADSPLFTPIHLSKNPWTYRPTAESYWAYP